MLKQAEIVAWFKEFANICDDAIEVVTEPRAAHFVQSFSADCREIARIIERGDIREEDAIADYITMRDT